MRPPTRGGRGHGVGVGPLRWGQGDRWARRGLQRGRLIGQAARDRMRLGGGLQRRPAGEAGLAAWAARGGQRGACGRGVGRGAGPPVETHVDAVVSGRIGRRAAVALGAAFVAGPGRGSPRAAVRPDGPCQAAAGALEEPAAAAEALRGRAVGLGPRHEVGKVARKRAHAGGGSMQGVERRG